MMRSPTQHTTQSASPVSSSKAGTTSGPHRSPWAFLVIGVLCLSFAVLASLFQIQTSEAFLLNGAPVSLQPDLSVLLQPFVLLSGHLSAAQAMAVIWGWGVELTFLIVGLAYEIAALGIEAANPRPIVTIRGWEVRFVTLFKWSTILLLALNGLSDFAYGALGSGIPGHLLFALTMTFVVAFFGAVGLRFLEEGLSLVAASKGTKLATVRASLHPWDQLLLGLLILLFWVVAFLFQIQTTEAFLLGQSLRVTTFFPDVEILKQPVLLFQGKLAPNEAQAAIVGWVCELAFLVCGIGYEVARHGISRANRSLSRWFLTGVLMIAGTDVVTDFFYSDLPSGGPGHLAFASVMGLVVLFFGAIGVNLLEHALKDVFPLKKPSHP